MSPTALPTARRQPEGITGRHVLIAFLSFFGVIFAANGVLLWQALGTHSGLVANEPYRKGLAYNQRIAAEEAQKALGWVDTIALDASGRTVATFAGSDGAPVSGLTVSVQIGRGASASHDQRLALVEETPGRYVAVAGPLEPGAWIVNLEARKPGAAGAADPDYRQRRKLWLKP